MARPFPRRRRPIAIVSKRHDALTAKHLPRLTLTLVYFQVLNLKTDAVDGFRYVFHPVYSYSSKDDSYEYF